MIIYVLGGLVTAILIELIRIECLLKDIAEVIEDLKEEME